MVEGVWLLVMIVTEMDVVLRHGEELRIEVLENNSNSETLLLIIFLKNI